MITQEEKASDNYTGKISNLQDDFAKLFDSTYWDTHEPFPFKGEGFKLGANEKYIRNYTCYESGNTIYRKTGGLVINGNYCGYEEGYIKPEDVLFYRESESTNVKEIPFSDLLPFATQYFPIDDYYTMHFAIHFRDTKTNEFFVIDYNFSRLNETFELNCKKYPNFYARRADYTEGELLEAYKSGEYGIMLHNQRNHKLARIFTPDEADEG